MSQLATQAETPKPLVDYLTSKSAMNRRTGSLEQLLGERTSGLRAILDDLEFEAQRRKELSSDLIGRIESDYLYHRNLLLPLETWALANDRSLDPRRSQLEERLQRLRGEAHREMIDCWRDTAQLKREFREWFKSYHDQAARVSLITAMGARGAGYEKSGSGPHPRAIQRGSAN